MDVHVFLCLYVRIKRGCVCKFACMFVCMHVRIKSGTLPTTRITAGWLDISANTHVFLCVCARDFMDVCVYVCMYVCMNTSKVARFTLL